MYFFQSLVSYLVGKVGFNLLKARLKTYHILTLYFGLI